MDCYLRGARMTNNIRQNFLENAKECRVQILCQNRIAQLRVNVAADAGPVLKFVSLPFDSCGKA